MSGNRAAKPTMGYQSLVGGATFSLSSSSTESNSTSPSQSGLLGQRCPHISQVKRLTSTRNGVVIVSCHGVFPGAVRRVPLCRHLDIPSSPSLRPRRRSYPPPRDTWSPTTGNHTGWSRRDTRGTSSGGYEDKCATWGGAKEYEHENETRTEMWGGRDKENKKRKKKTKTKKFLDITKKDVGTAQVLNRRKGSLSATYKKNSGGEYKRVRSQPEDHAGSGSLGGCVCDVRWYVVQCGEWDCRGWLPICWSGRSNGPACGGPATPGPFSGSWRCCVCRPGRCESEDHWTQAKGGRCSWQDQIPQGALLARDKRAYDGRWQPGMPGRTRKGYSKCHACSFMPSVRRGQQRDKVPQKSIERNDWRVASPLLPTFMWRLRCRGSCSSGEAAIKHCGRVSRENVSEGRHGHKNYFPSLFLAILPGIH